MKEIIKNWEDFRKFNRENKDRLWHSAEYQNYLKQPYAIDCGHTYLRTYTPDIVTYYKSNGGFDETVEGMLDWLSNEKKLIQAHD